MRILKEIRPEWPRVKLLIDLETAADYGVDKREALPYLSFPFLSFLFFFFYDFILFLLEKVIILLF